MIDDATARRLLLTVAARTADSAGAFEQLYRRCAPLLLGVVLRIVRRRELADEILHDAFVRIWHSAASFDPTGAPLGWLVAIARNRALDLMASHDMARVDSYHDTLDTDPEGALDRLFDWSDAADDSADRRRLARWLRDCLGELAAAERQALVLAYEHGLSHGDLAAHLRKPLGTVKTWVRRGLANLRDCVESCMERT
jgi:RNA polymerase sigma-70 factor (ECF subfamily)